MALINQTMLVNKLHDALFEYETGKKLNCINQLFSILYPLKEEKDGENDDIGFPLYRGKEKFYS